ncbi:hypothetical protein A3848_09490 [Paenibacillus sp. P32E]|nr:hypothetical protein A3848_09490 [Paenibacillus sp. P32E]
MDAIVNFLKSPVWFFGLSGVGASVVIVCAVFFIMSVKDAIWAYKESNKKAFSRYFSFSFICAVVIVWNIFSP